MNTVKTNQRVETLGILGGTFDPIHYGHIKPTIKSAKVLGLSQVLLLPAHIPPHKSNTIANVQQRTAMVELACQSHSLFTVDLRELKRNSFSYTVTTLKEIKKQYPATTLCFFMGMDSLLNFTKWHHWQEILTLCHLIVNARPGYDLTQLNSATRALLALHQIDSPCEINQQSSGGILMTKHTELNISSTELRHKFKQNLSCQHLLPINIIDYIKSQKLYL